MSAYDVYVSHLDSSTSEPQRNCTFWGIEESDWAAYALIQKNIASIQQVLEVKHHPQLTMENSKIALDVLEQVTCCIFKDDQWQRARILDRELSHTWTVEAFFLDSGVTSPVLFSAVRSLDFWEFLVEDIIEWPDLATKYSLAPTDYLDQGTLWTQDTLNTVRSNLVNRTWKAVPINIGDNQFVKLSKSDKNFPCAHITAQSNFPPSLSRSFTNNKISSSGCHDVIITHVAKGPSEFYLQLKSETSALLELRECLNAEIPSVYTGILKLGTVCTAVSSFDNLLHRGSVTGINKPNIGNRCAVFFPDIGIKEFVKTLQVYEIPDKLLVAPSFSYRASLFRSEELVGLESLFDLFSSLVKSVTHLKVEVVEECGLYQKVNLYDSDGRSLMEILSAFFINNPAPIHNVLAHAVQLPRRFGPHALPNVNARLPARSLFDIRSRINNRRQRVRRMQNQRRRRQDREKNIRNEEMEPAAGYSIFETNRSSRSCSSM